MRHRFIEVLLLHHALVFDNGLILLVHFCQFLSGFASIAGNALLFINLLVDRPPLLRHPLLLNNFILHVRNEALQSIHLSPGLRIILVFIWLFVLVLDALVDSVINALPNHCTGQRCRL